MDVPDEGLDLEVEWTRALGFLELEQRLVVPSLEEREAPRIPQMVGGRARAELERPQEPLARGVPVPIVVHRDQRPGPMRAGEQRVEREGTLHGEARLRDRRGGGNRRQFRSTARCAPRPAPRVAVRSRDRDRSRAGTRRWRGASSAPSTHSSRGARAGTRHGLRCPAMAAAQADGCRSAARRRWSRQSRPESQTRPTARDRSAATRSGARLRCPRAVP